MVGTLTNAAGATSFRFLNSHRSSTASSTKSTSNLHILNHSSNCLKASLHAVIDEPLVESTKMRSMSLYDVLSVKRDATAYENKSWNKNCNCWMFGVLSTLLASFWWDMFVNIWVFEKIDKVLIISEAYNLNASQNRLSGNTFQWFGGTKKDMNVVHLDVMTIKVEDINLNVGTGTKLGESIIHDVKGVSIIISRSLPDLLHQVPSTKVSIKVLMVPVYTVVILLEGFS
ncbi:hypothetical protein Hanom_Chr04g00363451 [Helianthus anomalus]